MSVIRSYAFRVDLPVKPVLEEKEVLDLTTHTARATDALSQDQVAARELVQEVEVRGSADSVSVPIVTNGIHVDGRAPAPPCGGRVRRWLTSP